MKDIIESLELFLCIQYRYPESSFLLSRTLSKWTNIVYHSRRWADTSHRERTYLYITGFTDLTVPEKFICIFYIPHNCDLHSLSYLPYLTNPSKLGQSPIQNNLFTDVGPVMPHLADRLARSRSLLPRSILLGLPIPPSLRRARVFWMLYLPEWRRGVGHQYK